MIVTFYCCLSDDFKGGKKILDHHYTSSQKEHEDRDMALEPLLNLNDPGYNYDDYPYDIDEEEYDESMNYDDYNTDVIAMNDNKEHKGFHSNQFLSSTLSFSQDSKSSKHKPLIHPNSVLPNGKVQSSESINKINNNNFPFNMATKSKYHKNYMLQNQDNIILPNPSETFGAKKSSSEVNDKDGYKKDEHASRGILNELPQFLQDPIDSYVIRRKSATLICEVTGADKAYFLCNGEAMGRSSKLEGKKSFNRGQHREEDTVRLANEKDMTGRMITVKRLSLDVTEGQIEEFFGIFTCRCDAWNKKGRSSSKNATVEISCKSKTTIINHYYYRFKMIFDNYK